MGGLGAGAGQSMAVGRAHPAADVNVSGRWDAAAQVFQEVIELQVNPRDILYIPLWGVVSTPNLSWWGLWIVGLMSARVFVGA